MAKTLGGGVIETISQDPSAKEFIEYFQPYAVELGAFVYAWNQLHDHLAELFWAIVGTKNGSIPLAIWHSTNSDRAQREMLRAASRARFPTERELDMRAKKEIEWLLTHTDKLANFRNDVIHAPYFFITDPPPMKLVANTFQGNPRAKGLKDRDLLHEFKWGRQTATILGVFAGRLTVTFHNLEASRIPWPEIPQLPNRGHQKSPKAGRQRSPPPLK